MSEFRGSVGYLFSFEESITIFTEIFMIMEKNFESWVEDFSKLLLKKIKPYITLYFLDFNLEPYLWIGIIRVYLKK